MVKSHEEISKRGVSYNFSYENVLLGEAEAKHIGIRVQTLKRRLILLAACEIICVNYLSDNRLSLQVISSTDNSFSSHIFSYCDGFVLLTI